MDKNGSVGALDVEAVAAGDGEVPHPAASAALTLKGSGAVDRLWAMCGPDQADRGSGVAAGRTPGM